MIHCEFENGNKASLRHVTVDAIVLNKDHSEILLVKRGPQLSNAGKYTTPGGYLERDETTTQAILREVLEETGYRSNIIALFRVNDNPNRAQEDRQNVDFVYLVEAQERIQEPDNESSEVRWFKLDNLPPQTAFAFDHYDNVLFYKDYSQKPFNLPLFNSK